MRARTRLDLFRRRFFPPERAPRPRFAAHFRECAGSHQRLGTDGSRQAIQSPSALWGSLGHQADAVLPIKPDPRALASPTRLASIGRQSHKGWRRSSHARRTPGLERSPQAAIKTKPIHRSRGIDGADAGEPHAGPLKRAFFQHAPRSRIAHPRAGMQRFTPEIAERIIDKGTGHLGCVATAPKGDAEPISEFGPLLARIDATRADQP